MPNTSDFEMRFKGERKKLELLKDILTEKHPFLGIKAKFFQPSFKKDNVLEIHGYSEYHIAYSTTDQPVSDDIGVFPSILEKEYRDKLYGSFLYLSLRNFLNKKSVFVSRELKVLNEMDKFELIDALEKNGLNEKALMKIIENKSLQKEVNEFLNKTKSNPYFTRPKYVYESEGICDESVLTLAPRQKLMVNLQSLCFALEIQCEAHGIEPLMGFEEFFTIYPTILGDYYRENTDMEDGKPSVLYGKFTI